MARSIFHVTEYILHPPIAVFSHEREWKTDEDFKRRLIKKPVLKLSLKLERVYYPYLIQVFMVYALIMLGAITAFFLDIEEGADRLVSTYTYTHTHRLHVSTHTHFKHTIE